MIRINHPFASLILGALLISGCSAPPSAGIWQADSDNQDHYTLFKVYFDGKAQAFVKNNENSVLRCFWQAADADTINMSCTHANAPETELSYVFQTVGEDKGLLIKDGVTVASFIRTSRKGTPPPAKKG